MNMRIKNLRLNKGLTQVEMGKVLCCSQKAYSSYEREEVNIPSSVWVALAKFYGTSVDYLMGMTDVKTPHPPKKKRLYT